MNQSLTKETPAALMPAALIEKVVIGGNLANLTPAERLIFYQQTCESLGLNQLTRPFEYIILNGKLTLYARKDATEQLRSIHNISVYKLEREISEGIYTVTAYLRSGSGREDSSIGAVSIEGLKGEARANAMMKAETKAKRRGTLSMCGLGMLDETEVETIPNARPYVESAPKEAYPTVSGHPDENFPDPSVGSQAEAKEGYKFGKFEPLPGDYSEPSSPELIAMQEQSKLPSPGPTISEMSIELQQLMELSCFTSADKAYCSTFLKAKPSYEALTKKLRQVKKASELMKNEEAKKSKAKPRNVVIPPEDIIHRVF